MVDILRRLPDETLEQIQSTSEFAQQYGLTGEVNVTKNQYDMHEVSINIGSSTVVWNISPTHLKENE